MKIVFFDGHCNLCNASVDWVMSRDSKKALKFASLQGETARRTLPATDTTTKAIDLDTVIYFRDGKRFERSSAALMVLFDLGGAWKLTYPLLLIPKFLRDLAYIFIAKNRYRFFGRKDTCRLPTPEERERILP